VSDLPPPPPPPSSTQVVGQQAAPSTAVPVGGVPQSTSFTIAGRPTNTMAAVSLVSAIVAPFGHLIGLGGITLTVVSLITGHMALNQIKQTGEGGHTMAMIGLIISYIHLVITALVVIFLFSLVVAFLTFLFHAVASA
jgi:hypothetical protein